MVVAAGHIKKKYVGREGCRGIVIKANFMGLKISSQTH